MSLIRASNSRRSPYTQDGRTNETLVDQLGMIGIANDKLRDLFDCLAKDLQRATRNLQTNRKKIVPSEILETVNEIVRVTEERGARIDFIIDLCYILKVDSSDLLNEFWQGGENT